MLKHPLIIAGAVLALFAVTGCAPTQLGDISRNMDKPLLNDESYGSGKLVSRGETIQITLNIPPDGVCKGQFKLVESVKSYPVLASLPGFASSPYLRYSGQWEPNQSATCIKALNGPGGQEREITIQEADLLNNRVVFICDEAPGGALCTGGRTYTIKE